jgi:hypothetical protein
VASKAGSSFNFNQQFLLKLFLLEVELEVLFFELFIEQLSTFEGRKRHLAKAKKKLRRHVEQETTRLTEKNAKYTKFCLKNYD